MDRTKPNPDYVTPKKGEVVGYVWSDKGFRDLVFDGKAVHEVLRKSMYGRTYKVKSV
jgi:hypothetical protein